jgi:ribonuclease P protein component
VVHLNASTDDTASEPFCRVGFVVGRDVGGAVTRNRVRRRLRHLVRARLDELPAGVMVVRALPASAGADFPELRDDLARCLGRVLP